MIIGKFKKKVRGTVKFNGIEVLGSERKYKGHYLHFSELGIKPTKYPSFEQGLNALTNFLSSSKFQKKVIKKYKMNLHLENLEGHNWYICISKKT